MLKLVVAISRLHVIITHFFANARDFWTTNGWPRIATPGVTNLPSSCRVTPLQRTTVPYFRSNLYNYAKPQCSAPCDRIAELEACMSFCCVTAANLNRKSSVFCTITSSIRCFLAAQYFSNTLLGDVRRCCQYAPRVRRTTVNQPNSLAPCARTRPC